MEGFNFDKESLLKDVTDYIKDSFYKNAYLEYNRENIYCGPGTNKMGAPYLAPELWRSSVNISKYERYIDESPDIYSIIKKEEEFVKQNKLEEYRIIPPFCNAICTNEINLLYQEVCKYDKHFIKGRIKDKILANHIINSHNTSNGFTDDISYLFMVDTLRKLKKDYDLENAPSPEPAPSPEINNLSVIEAIPLTNTNIDEIKLLKEKVKLMEEKIKILMDWHNKYNHSK